MSLDYIFGFISVLGGSSKDPDLKEAFSKEDVYKHLKESTDEDFGYDAQAWRDYFRQYDLWSIEDVEVAFKGHFRRQKEESEQENSDNEEDLT